jgi:SAM-dependent methyltransferase
VGEKKVIFMKTPSEVVVAPIDTFYESYTPPQIQDIIRSLKEDQETPLEYTYIDGGAQVWDEYAKQQQRDNAANILGATVAFLELNAAPIEKAVEENTQLQVVDLGPGNGLPVRKMLQRMLENGRPISYVPIDISPDILTLVVKNMDEWFGQDTLPVRPFVKDITCEGFGKDVSVKEVDEDVANLVMLLGGTLANFKSPSGLLKNIQSNLKQDDLFVYTGYLDTSHNRGQLHHYQQQPNKAPTRAGLILKYLGITESMYEVSQQFDEEERARTVNIIPNTDIHIEFDLPEGVHYVKLENDVPILIGRHRHWTMPELIGLFESCGLDVMHATKSNDRNFVMLAAKADSFA